MQDKTYLLTKLFHSRAVTVNDFVVTRVAAWLESKVLLYHVAVCGEAALDATILENAVWPEEVVLWQAGVARARSALATLMRVCNRNDNSKSLK